MVILILSKTACKKRGKIVLTLYWGLFGQYTSKRAVWFLRNRRHRRWSITIKSYNIRDNNTITNSLTTYWHCINLLTNWDKTQQFRRSTKSLTSVGNVNLTNSTTIQTISSSLREEIPLYFLDKFTLKFTEAKQWILKCQSKNKKLIQ